MPTLLDSSVAMLPIKQAVLLVSTRYYLFQHVITCSCVAASNV